MYFIDFTPPMSGINGTFNTFRLGLKWFKTLKPGDTVLLLDKKQCQTIGKAVVESVDAGTLQEMADRHAAKNHNQKDSDAVEAPQRLITNMIKRYGPHKVSYHSKVSVVSLREI